MADQARAPPTPSLLRYPSRICHLVSTLRFPSPCCTTFFLGNKGGFWAVVPNVTARAFAFTEPPAAPPARTIATSAVDSPRPPPLPPRLLFSPTPVALPRSNDFFDDASHEHDLSGSCLDTPGPVPVEKTCRTPSLLLKCVALARVSAYRQRTSVSASLFFLIFF